MSLAEIESIRALARQMELTLDACEDTRLLAQPVRVGELTAPNSLAIHPMEGCDGDAEGRPGPLTLRRYERFAAGGAGLLWVEAIAVVPEGRANPRQLWLHEGSRQAFADMVRMIRNVAQSRFGADHRRILVAPLTHSGRYSRPTNRPRPMIAQHCPHRDARMKLPADYPLVSDDYLERLSERYLVAARLAFEAGFDAVDIKACHGYLVNELLGARTRPGKYGGEFENRTRLLLTVMERIREELGPQRMITARLGVFDAIPYPYGWGVDCADAAKPDLSEPKRLIAEMVRRGLTMLNVTAANPYYNPHCNRPYNEPIAGGYESPEHPLVGVERLIRLAGEIQRAFPDLAVVGSGYSWLRTRMPYVAAWAKKNKLATFIGCGRMAFAYPDFPRDILEGRGLDPNRVCVACSGCTQIMRDGGMTGCVVRDNAVYGPIFERGRMSNRDNLIRLARQCRQCVEPTCRTGCSAGIDIPRFIKLFLEGDDRAAYEVLREANVFPEICAWLCPVEQQCEGNCLMKFIGDGPLPIADIQRFLAEEANREGWSRLRLPPHTTGKRVAILGAGPAGLACAARLLERGHAITIFDRNKSFGGMIESVIPADRQSSSLRNEIAAIFDGVPADRMELRLGVLLDKRCNLDVIFAQGFDAAFVGFGLPKAVTTPGAEAPSDVWNALAFLEKAKREPNWNLRGKTVAVIGGGNTAMDAAVCARQLGAKDVYLIYRRSFEQMPAWPAERDRALAVGVHFLILTQQLGYLEKDGRLAAIKVCPTRLGEPDATGRRAPQPIRQSAYELPVDMAIEAIGQEAPPDLAEVLPGVEIVNGLIRTRPGSHATSRSGVFAGGDLVRGPSTVVAAVADGMQAAAEMDRFLKGGLPR